MSSNLKKPIIIDLGSSEIKTGFSGQITPVIKIKNILGVLNNNQYISDDCDNLYDKLKIRNPIQRGVFINEDDIPIIFNYIFKKLELNNEQKNDHPLLISEPINNKIKNSEKISEILFEKMNINSLIFGKQPLLSLISTGYSTGIIIESGSDITQSCISFEGYVTENSFLRYNYGGRDITNTLKILINRNNRNIKFDSFNNIKALKEIKEKYCYIKNLTNIDDEFNSIPSEYLLPDGSKLNLIDEKILAPEILFNNKLIYGEYLTFHEMIINSIDKADINIKNKLYKTIVLSGGNTQFKGIEEKMISKISQNAPKGIDIKIRTQMNPELCCWNGGNIISCLSSFQKMLVTKKDWEEYGKNIIQIKNI